MVSILNPERDTERTVQNSLSGFKIDCSVGRRAGPAESRRMRAHKEEGRLGPGQTYDQSIKIRWALSTFKPFKSTGTDVIVPALLQQGAVNLIQHLCRIFMACMAYGFIPTAWRQVKVTFIPKPGNLDYTETKAYFPISLSPFLLKTMEKLVDRHIRDGVLRFHPLYRNQHAYQKRKVY
jgi:hypothetical protein